jgi:uroporphyrinogen decarboxylase
LLNKINSDGLEVDVDFLCRRTPQEIQEHTKQVMDICSQDGGYAIGSGNTIANYIPVKNYLAMIEAARQFNGNR